MPLYLDAPRSGEASFVSTGSPEGVEIGPESSLEEAVYRRLAAEQQTVSCAESCTGGGLGFALTREPGSSSLFIGGVVTYSVELKVSLLGVLEETISRYGAVSPQCAAEMVRGCRERLGGRNQISITGIAGPGGGTNEKPVGLVYIGQISGRGEEIFEFRFTGDRGTVRRKSVEAAMLLLLRPVQLSLSELLERIEGRLLTAL